jgi:hypothetical protein
MMVENHEIEQEDISDPTLIISGRTFYTFLENRIVGTNQVRGNFNIIEYPFPADYTWNQAVKLINDHILNGVTTTINDSLPFVAGYTGITGTGVSTARTIKRMDVLTALLQLLEIDDLGVRTIRVSSSPNRWGSDTYTLFSIYKGVNRTANVIFSWDRGEISGAGYLWSVKSNKTSAMVVGQKYNTIQDDVVDFSPGPIYYDRRMTIVDGGDIEDTNTDTGVISAKMKVRAHEVIANKNKVTITRLDIAPKTRYIYNRDYQLGDLVMVEGNFNTRAAMRVIEHVEIMDENGSSDHPTLSLPLA